MTVEEKNMFDLENTLKAYNQLRDKINAQASKSATFFLIGSLAHFLSLNHGDFEIRAMGFSVDVRLAVPMMFVAGAYLILIRTLSLYSFYLVRKRFSDLYYQQFDEYPNLNYFGEAGIVVAINRFRYLGFWGQATRYTILVLLFLPVYIVVYHVAVNLDSYSVVSRWMFFSSFLLANLAGILELCSRHVGEKVYAKLL